MRIAPRLNTHNICFYGEAKKYRIFDFFRVRSNFISLYEHQKQYFHKQRSHTKKIKFSASFMHLFTIIKLLSAPRLSCQKTNFF